MNKTKNPICNVSLRKIYLILHIWNVCVCVCALLWKIKIQQKKKKDMKNARRKKTRASLLTHIQSIFVYMTHILQIICGSNAIKIVNIHLIMTWRKANRHTILPLHTPSTMDCVSGKIIRMIW